MKEVQQGRGCCNNYGSARRDKGDVVFKRGVQGMEGRGVGLIEVNAKVEVVRIQMYLYGLSSQSAGLLAPLREVWRCHPELRTPVSFRLQSHTPQIPSKSGLLRLDGSETSADSGRQSLSNAYSECTGDRRVGISGRSSNNVEVKHL